MNDILKNKNIVLCSQVYPPDPTSVGQHVQDLAQSLAEHHDVLVYTAQQGFYDANERYPLKEQYGRLSIRRLRFASFGKGSMIKRIFGGLLFSLQCIFKLLFIKDLGALVVSTSPPMGGMIGVAIKLFRPKVRVVYWLMDLNPDQWIQVGGISPNHPLALMLNALNRAIFKRLDSIIVLDRYMYDLCAKKIEADYLSKFVICPPWSHDSVLEPVVRETNPFLKEHELSDKRVIMFSGNLGPSSNIRTLLDALIEKPREEIALVVIGGGEGREDVTNSIEKGLANVVMLPYLPMDEIKYSLSAGDIHIVSIGDHVVGINHPCKIYGVMAVGRPVLAIGPETSHLGDILKEARNGWLVEHGEINAMNAILDQILALEISELDAIGDKGRQLLNRQFAQQVLIDKVQQTIIKG